MKLYHGSNIIIKAPTLVPQNRFLDFGFGFYTTTNHDQATSFATKVVLRRGQGKPIVNVYDFDEVATSTLNVLRFDAPDEAWLDFVAANRTGASRPACYDLIIGPVANDDVYRTLQLYLSGLLTKEQALAALKIKSLYDQYVFCTQRALALLTLASYEEV